MEVPALWGTATDENIKTVEFEGEEYEEIVDDNYDPEMGIDPDKK